MTFKLARTLLLTLAAASCAEPAPPRQVTVRAGTLLDGSGGPPLRSVRLLVADGIITAVQPDEGPLPPDAATLDARELTVLPGLVVPLAGAWDGCAAEALTSGARRALMSAITSMGDPRVRRADATALARTLGVARARGPRTFWLGPIVGSADSEGLRALASAAAELDVVRVAPGPGACAAMEEAKSQDKPTLVHLRTPAELSTVEACRPDTLAWEGSLAELPHDGRVAIASWRIEDEALLASLVAQDRVDVVATGSATCGAQLDFGRIEGLRRAGASAPQLVRALTSAGAEVLGVGEALGRAGVGYRADLAAVAGNLEEDMRVLGAVRWVMVDGVLQTFDSPGRWTAVELMLRTWWARATGD